MTIPYKKPQGSMKPTIPYKKPQRSTNPEKKEAHYGSEAKAPP
jgi:hypothetical protein